MKDLSAQVAVPLPVMHGYISRCIAGCLVLGDQYMQKRFVRLICVFLQTLIHTKIVDVSVRGAEPVARCL